MDGYQKKMEQLADLRKREAERLTTFELDFPDLFMGDDVRRNIGDIRYGESLFSLPYTLTLNGTRPQVDLENVVFVTSSKKKRGWAKRCGFSLFAESIGKPENMIEKNSAIGTLHYSDDRVLANLREKVLFGKRISDLKENVNHNGDIFVLANDTTVFTTESESREDYIRSRIHWKFIDTTMATDIRKLLLEEAIGRNRPFYVINSWIMDTFNVKKESRLPSHTNRHFLHIYLKFDLQSIKDVLLNALDDNPQLPLGIDLAKPEYLSLAQSGMIDYVDWTAGRIGRIYVASEDELPILVSVAQGVSALPVDILLGRPT